jgi:hypothetical protein
MHPEQIRLPFQPTRGACVDRDAGEHPFRIVEGDVLGCFRVSHGTPGLTALGVHRHYGVHIRLLPQRVTAADYGTPRPRLGRHRHSLDVVELRPPPRQQRMLAHSPPPPAPGPLDLRGRPGARVHDGETIFPGPGISCQPVIPDVAVSAVGSSHTSIPLLGVGARAGGPTPN